MKFSHLIILLLIAGFFWTTLFIVLTTSPGPRELFRVLVETPGEGGIATSSPSLASEPSRTAVAPVVGESPSPSIQRVIPTGDNQQQAPRYRDPETWADEDRAYDYCRAQPNGPWKLIPKDATLEQVLWFKYILRDPLIAYASNKARVMADEDIFTSQWQDRLRNIDLDAQEQFSRCFQRVWPTARQPDPVVR